MNFQIWLLITKEVNLVINMFTKKRQYGTTGFYYYTKS
jgi:hypothetical protein